MEEKLKVAKRHLVFCRVLFLAVSILLVYVYAHYEHDYWQYYSEFRSIMMVNFKYDWDEDQCKEEYAKWLNHQDYNYISVIDGEPTLIFEDRYPTTSGIPSILYSDKIEPGYYFRMGSYGDYIIMTITADTDNPLKFTALFDSYTRYNSRRDRTQYTCEMTYQEKPGFLEKSGRKAISDDLSVMMAVNDADTYVSVNVLDEDSALDIYGNYIRVLKFN